MPQNSRYSNDEFEALMNKVILTLEESGANRDLSLMVLGNVITHILNTQVKPDNREAMASQFADVLKKSTCRISSPPARYKASELGALVCPSEYNHCYCNRLYFRLFFSNARHWCGNDIFAGKLVWSY